MEERIALNVNNVQLEIKRQDRPVFLESVAEFIGMTMFVLILGYASGNPSFALGLYLIFIFFAHISGSHFNPSITIGQFIYFDKTPDSIPKLFGNIIGQCLGAALAWIISYSLDNRRKINPTKGESISTFDAMFCEFFWGGFLVFLNLFVCSPKTSPSKNHLVNIGLFTIGLYYIIAIGSPISGASYNAAIGFCGNLLAMLIIQEQPYRDSLFITSVSPIVGAIAFTLLFKYVFEPFYVRMRKE